MYLLHDVPILFCDLFQQFPVVRTLRVLCRHDFLKTGTGTAAGAASARADKRTHWQ
jgi:hypothetical protein